MLKIFRRMISKIVQEKTWRPCLPVQMIEQKKQRENLKVGDILWTVILHCTIPISNKYWLFVIYCRVRKWAPKPIYPIMKILNSGPVGLQMGAQEDNTICTSIKILLRTISFSLSFPLLLSQIVILIGFHSAFTDHYSILSDLAVKKGENKGLHSRLTTCIIWCGQLELGLLTGKQDVEQNISDNGSNGTH